MGVGMGLGVAWALQGLNRGSLARPSGHEGGLRGRQSGGSSSQGVCFREQGLRECMWGRRGVFQREARGEEPVERNLWKKDPTEVDPYHQMPSSLEKQTAAHCPLPTACGVS